MGSRGDARGLGESFVFMYEDVVGDQFGSAVCFLFICSGDLISLYDGFCGRDCGVAFLWFGGLPCRLGGSVGSGF